MQKQPDDAKQEVRDALQAIANRHRGRLTPEDVVEAARDCDSPLHSCFVWDDTAAAHAFRLEQARTVIVSARIPVVTNRETILVPVWVRDVRQPPHAQGYVQAVRLVSERDRAKETFEAELARIDSAVSRARGIAATLGFSDELSEYLKTL